MKRDTWNVMCIFYTVLVLEENLWNTTLQDRISKLANRTYKLSPKYCLEFPSRSGNKCLLIPMLFKTFQAYARTLTFGQVQKILTKESCLCYSINISHTSFHGQRNRRARNKPAAPTDLNHRRIREGFPILLLQSSCTTHQCLPTLKHSFTSGRACWLVDSQSRL